MATTPKWYRVTYTADDVSEKALGDVCIDGGGYVATDTDVQVANCLTDLHVNQPTSCIDVDGSTCMADGTAVGNMRLTYSLDTSNDFTLPHDIGWRVKSIIQSLPETTAQDGLGWDIGTNINMGIANDDGTSTAWTVQIRGTGDQDC